MQIIIKVIGKERSYFKDLYNEYVKRLKWSIRIEEYDLNKNFSQPEIIQKEGELLLKDIDSSAYIFALDERGEHCTSHQFFAKIKSVKLNYKKVFFLIGGAFGLSDEVRNRANMIVALSKMTLPHKLARLILIEQIYRAYTIDCNHPYHK